MYLVYYQTTILARYNDCMCPICNNILVPYISGYPSDFLFEMEKDKKIKWSGTCIFNPDMPKSWCYICDKGFDIFSEVDH